MRLSPREQATISQLAKQFFGTSSSVILFGSRVDDCKRGGDIDLLIQLNEPVADQYKRKLQFRAALKHAIGDQKIDVVLADTTDARGIVQQALATGIEL
ncbi:Nucleotidyltransferase domain-containing protein [Desulfonatronum zhilinae]|nr:Nucleotidyltransferase domain-containing protein [Desulfonatronum zhilinae]